ncbi:MAG: hypothetical protein P4L74_06225 [Candidatus Doudnabacteria bacterium]|nr:hypothetical protein [Candidatus Doudnabacteria bacterium]
MKSFAVVGHSITDEEIAALHQRCQNAWVKWYDRGNNTAFILGELRGNLPDVLIIHPNIDEAAIGILLSGREVRVVKAANAIVAMFQIATEA